ncbi:Permeases of the major facilitator superfamily protein [Enhygromyxa salina]|uniref:Permeases of the major facilitator superfamily protein n=1 Tax=Enhygromyxa salina TaxID=215803 RepID=A0A0C2D917_9BACT|nr:hypothetical protein [Enhygromyxa salina]KIG19561.1 Permeases of the major facilitator superfamily protein [Enhygromyxa salina]
MFARTIDRVSAEGKLRFTEGQLYYELCRTLGPVARGVFEQLWARWLAVHGAPAMIVTPWPTQAAAPTLREDDIGDYSFDRVVITDHAWIVDFLLCNNFHFETNSAVLSIDGHPAGRFEMIRAMLHKNPQIIVIAIHDASSEGCQLPRRLVTEDGWFREHGYVVDAGLTPAHRELYGELWQAREPIGESANADDPDAQWLSRYMLDFAVVRPEKAMRRLFRASRRYGALLDLPNGPRVGEVYTDKELLGPGKHKRIAAGEEVD